MKALKRLDIFKLAQTIAKSPDQVLELLSDFAEVTHGIFYVFDFEKKSLVFANKKLEAVLGYTKAEINRMKENAEENLIHPEDESRFMSEMQKIMSGSTKKLSEVELRIRHKSGSWSPVRTRSLRLHFNGKPSSLLFGCVEDLGVETELTKQKEKEHLRTLHTEKLAVLNDMAGGIAHEINNPLAIILGRAQAMKMRLQKNIVDKDQLIEGLEKIEGTVSRISNIISALRLVTRDGSNDPFVPCSLKSILSDLQIIWFQRLLNNGIEFSVSDYDEKLSIVCRSSQIANALLNLISNSYEAVRNHKQPWIKVQVKEVTEFIEISVEDSGIGVPKNIRERIFNPFFTTRPVGEATGLGLTIASSVVKEHKGTLYLDEKSANTRFVILIPKNFKSISKVA